MHYKTLAHLIRDVLFYCRPIGLRPNGPATSGAMPHTPFYYRLETVGSKAY